MGLAIQLDHRFGSKCPLNKLHRLVYTESYTDIQNYKYCLLNDSNIVEISVASGTPGVFDIASDEKIDDEMEVDVELEGLSADESETQTDDQVLSIEGEDTSSNSAVTQFVGDNIDLRIVSIYRHTPFHSMSMIKVTNPTYESITAAVNRVKLKAIEKAKILKATEDSSIHQPETDGH